MIPVVIVAVSVAGLVMLRRRRRAEAPDQRRELSAMALHTARGVRDGMAVLDALEASGERATGVVGEQVQAVVASTRRGASLDEALERWATRPGRPPTRGAPSPDDVALVAAALRFGRSLGGDVAAALDGVSVTLLDRAEVDDESRALTSQARASVVVLCLLPPVGVVIFAMLQPQTMGSLFTTGAGRACLVAATTLDLLAVVVCRRLVAGALR